MVFLNSWNLATGFRFPLQLPESLTEDFHRNKIYFRVKLDSTGLWETGNAHNCRKNYTGPLFDDYLLLSRMLNFTLMINEDKPKKNCFACSFRDAWRKVSVPFPDSPEIKKVIDDSADVAGGGLIAYHEAVKVAQISAATFYQTGANIVSIEPKKSISWYALFQPFTWYIWFLTISTIPLCGGVLWLMRKYPIKESDKEPLKVDAMWDIAIVLLWDSVGVRDPPLKVCLLLSTYMLATFILVGEYMGAVTSFMVKTKYLSPPIETAEQLWKTDYKWIGGRIREYYLNYFDSIEDIEKRLVLLKFNVNADEIKNALTTLIDHPDEYVYFEKKGLIEWNVCQHSIDLRGRKLYYSRQTIGDYNTYLYLNKKSVYTEKLNRKILTLQDMGIIQMNNRRFINEGTKRKCHLTDEEKVEMITLVHFKLGIVLLAIGYAIAFLKFVMEIRRKIRKYLGEFLLNMD